MDKINQRFDDYAKRIFGPSARIAGSFGTVRQPGDIRIMVDDRLLGTGGTFQDALADVTTRNHDPSGRAAR